MSFTAAVNLCKCNNCEGVFVDTNPQVNAPLFSIDYNKFQTLMPIEDMKACPICLTDEYLTDDVPDSFTALEQV